MKRLAQHTGLVVGAILVALCIGELGLRLVVGSKQHRLELRAMLDQSRKVSPNSDVGNVSLRGLIQPSRYDRIVYELKPGLRATFVGVPVTINQTGYREREVSVTKPAGTFRIVGLGDSVTFGWGVFVEATYLRVLENLLQRRGDPVRYETLNFGVPGYNAVMEVETFKHKARHYQPDLVVVGYIGNDGDIPNFMKRSALRWPSNLFLYNLLVHGAAAMRNMGWELMPQRWDSADGRHGRFVPVGDIPAQFSDMIGPEAVLKAYYELAAMTRELGVPVVIIGEWRGRLDPIQVAQLASHSRFVFLESNDAHEDYAHLHKVELTAKDIHLSSTDNHPNALGHQIIAEAIYKTIVDRHLLSSVDAPSR